MALHRGGKQLADRVAQRSKPVQLTGVRGARDVQVVDVEPGREVRRCGQSVAHLTINRKDGAGELDGQRAAP